MASFAMDLHVCLPQDMEKLPQDLEKLKEKILVGDGGAEGQDAVTNVDQKISHHVS